MPAELEEIKEAENEGININFLENVKSTRLKEDKLEAKFVKMRLSEFDRSGRRRPVEIESSLFSKEIDLLILAIGQKTALGDLLDNAVKINRNGTICCSLKGKTTCEDIFAGGDVVTGPSTVVEAIGEAQKAAESIDIFLSGGRDEYPWNVKDIIQVPFDPEEEPVEYQRNEGILISLKERNLDSEVEKTWDSNIACRESERCLRCEFRKEEEEK